MCSQSLRISQGGCEFGKVANLAMWFANLAKWFANLAKWFAKLAMRIFAKVLKFLCETNEQCMWLANLAMWFAKFARVANWLPTGCQNSCFAFFSKYAPKFAQKLLN